MNKKLLGIIVIALIVLGGIYMWTQKSANDQAAALLSAEEQDTIAKIEANYAQIDVTNLDAGMEEIERDLQ